jgi:beta-lactamase superfamily II metal-dependent hydrolase
VSLSIEMLPANHGDCLWIEYGDPDDPHRILIDGGPPYARERLEERIPDGGCHFELLVITHVDADHIGGILSYLARLPEGVTFGDVWFNGWRHLPTDARGPVQGEMLSATIEQRALPWNERFGRGAVQIAGDSLPRVELPGGLALTLLSPTRDALAELVPFWRDEVSAAGLDPGSSEEALALLHEREGLRSDVRGAEAPDVDRLATRPFEEDESAANGSSIALLAEFQGRTVLLSADAFPSQVRRAVLKLAAERGVARLPLDALKMSHHGSKGNTSIELIELLDCRRYLFSTNGKIFGHPAQENVARVVLHGGDTPELMFNYRSPTNEVWDDARLADEHGYTCTYGDGRLRVEL